MRLRPKINVTLNPTLVERLKEYGETNGENRLSALIDKAIEAFLSQVSKEATTEPLRIRKTPRRSR